LFLFAGSNERIYSILSYTVSLNKALQAPAYYEIFFICRVSVGGGQQGGPITAGRSRHPASGDQLLCNPLGSQVSTSLFWDCKKTRVADPELNSSDTTSDKFVISADPNPDSDDIKQNF
jgi:hypothetical protein